jgi:Ser-tRNA(Ala) deacylase AlaX
MLSTIEDGYAVNKYNENAFDINILDEVTKKFKKLIKTDTNVETYPDKGNENFRYWKCMNYIVPCGGVHVDNLNEIDDVNVEIIHKKKAITIKIFFENNYE